LRNLCETLIKEFDNYKTFEQWEKEISNLRQIRDESIEKYIIRIRKLNSDMIIAISNYPDQAARTGTRVFATNKLIDHFIGGFHKNVSQHLLVQKFNILENAIEGTIRFIRKSKYHTERFKENRFNQSSYITCNYCKKIDHSENECKKKLFIRNRNENHNFQYSNNDAILCKILRAIQNEFNNIQANR